MKPQSEDVALRNAVLEEFEWNVLLDPSQLGVDVNDRVVTLVGTLDSIAQMPWCPSRRSLSASTTPG